MKNISTQTEYSIEYDGLNILYNIQKEEITSLKKINQLSQEEIDCLTEENQNLKKICIIIQETMETWIGRTLKFQYLFQQIKKINGFREESNDIVECIEDIDVPDDIDIHIKNKYIPTCITNVIDTDIINNNNYINNDDINDNDDINNNDYINDNDDIIEVTDLFMDVIYLLNTLNIQWNNTIIHKFKENNILCMFSLKSFIKELHMNNNNDLSIHDLKEKLGITIDELKILFNWYIETGPRHPLRFYYSL